MLIGNLGSDPQIRVLESGVKVAQFRLATNQRYVAADGQQRSHTEWHSIVAWRAAASYAQEHLKQGSYVRVEGEIRSRTSIDPHTKAVNTHYEIVAWEVKLITNDALNPNAENQKESKGEPAQQTAPVDPDNLPF